MNKEEREIRGELYPLAKDPASFEYFCRLLKDAITGSVSTEKPPSELLEKITQKRITLECPHCDAPIGFMDADLNETEAECYECGGKVNLNDGYPLYYLKEEFFCEFLRCFKGVVLDE